MEGTNDILITLGNVDGSLIFSPNNESKDRKKAKSEHIFEVIHNKEAFFEQAWKVITQSVEENLILPWDSYFFKWKNANLSLLIGDFDLVSTWKRVTPFIEKMEINIKEFFLFLSVAKNYF